MVARPDAPSPVALEMVLYVFFVVLSTYLEGCSFPLIVILLLPKRTLRNVHATLYVVFSFDRTFSKKSCLMFSQN